MHNTVLASLAAITLGAGSFVLPAPAAATTLDTPEAELTAVMGPAQEYQRGLTINGVAPTLRSVVVDGESILAYCIEYWIRAADPDHESAVTAWDEFTGDNNFKTDPQVRQHVAWILRNSYPTLSLDELTEHTGAVELSEAEAIAATQAAIWYFTDDVASDGNLVVEDAPGDGPEVTAHSAANVTAVFDYLTGSDNTGLSEQAVQASVTLQDATDPEQDLPAPVADVLEDDNDHLLGPILLDGSTPAIDLALQPADADDDFAIDELTVVDEQGQSLDLDQSVRADQVWVHVPAETETAAVHLVAESIEYGYTGRLIIPEPDGQRRFQTIVVVDQATDHASTQLELAWQKPVMEEPEVNDAPPAADPIPESVAPPTEQPADEPIVQEQPVQEAPTQAPISAELVAEEPATEEPPVAQAPSDEPTPVNPPEAAEQSPKPETAPHDQPDVEPGDQLAETGPAQTRNVLIALGTLAVGACLLLVNRLRRVRT